MLKKLLLTSALLVGLSACTGGKISPAETVLLSCETVARTIVQLTPYRAEGKLTKGEVEIVDKAIGITQPLCTGPAPDVNGNLQGIAIDAGARMLQGVLMAVLN